MTTTVAVKIKLKDGRERNGLMLGRNQRETPDRLHFVDNKDAADFLKTLDHKLVQVFGIQEIGFVDNCLK
ncbi:MAG: hypothetical protein RLZZ46_337 [Bacteroidota bacterium]|jgi:hypothetical protein